MSNTGSSGLPPGIGSGDKGFPPSRAELKARIIAIRGEARVQKVREVMEGQLVRNNNDGTSRIQTPRGEIDVKLPLREPLPEGTRLSVEIGRGAPPKQVIIRIAPATPNQPQTQPQPQIQPLPGPQPPQTTENRGAAPAPKSTIPPEARAAIDETLRISQAPQTVQNAVSRNLTEGDIVRLQPLPITPDELVENLVTQSRAAKIEAAVTRVINAAQTLALQTQILPNNNLVINTPQTINALQTPILQNSFAQPFIQNAFAITPPSVPGPQGSTPPAASLLQNAPLQTSALPAAAQNTISAAISLQTPPPAVTPQFQINRLQPSSAPQIATNLPNDDLRIAQITPSNFAVIDAKADFDISLHINVTRESGNPANILQAKAHQSVMKVVGFINTPNIGMAQTSGTQNLAVLSVPSLNAATGTIQTSFMTLPWQTANLVTGQVIQATPINVSALSMPQMAGNMSGQPAAPVPFIPAQFFGQYSWPAADEVIQSLQQALPQAAAQTLAQSLPSLAGSPARLPPAALLFVAAMRGGDISGWLGDKNVDLLKRIGKTDALNRITGDLNGMQRSSSEPVSQDWRAMALPFMSDQGLSKMMLYYRYDEKESAQDKERKGTRFVFDLELSRIGPVQIDGLHRPMDAKNARLDLIVRTQKHLGEAMQKYMRRLYIDALESNDLAGELSFQGTPERFVKIDWPSHAQIY